MGTFALTFMVFYMHVMSRLLLMFTGVNLQLVLWMVLSDSMMFGHPNCKLSRGIFSWHDENIWLL